jgi:transcriptional regulator with GAF, ATPase, and Fis domain
VGDIIGRSPLMLALFESLPALAATDIGVPFSERPAGQGLVAKALHNSSPRRDAPFIKVNCAALPANLLESELFGYRKGRSPMRARTSRHVRARARRHALP